MCIQTCSWVPYQDETHSRHSIAHVLAWPKVVHNPHLDLCSMSQQSKVFPGLQPHATMSAEDVWRPLLSGVLQEFDHRLDLSRHSALLEQVDVTTLISAEQVTLAIQQEMRSAGRMSSTLESGRELSTVAYDLSAFTNSVGPYTLHEIYQTFSFCDKIERIQDRATEELRRRLLVPSSFGDKHEAVLGHQDFDSCKKMSRDEVSRVQDTGEAEDTLQEAEAHELQEPKDDSVTARWKPPNREEMHLFLRAGAHMNHIDDRGQTLLMTACRACCFLSHQSQDSAAGKQQNWSNIRPEDEAFVEIVTFLCEEAPATWSFEDPMGRTPLVLFAEVFGLMPNTEKISQAPISTLRALLDGLSVCFSKAPSTVIWTLRCSEASRNAAEHFNNFFFQEQLPPPEQLVRLILWMDVVMGGAWEVSDQRHVTERLLDSVHVEEMMDSAVRFRDFAEKMEKSVEQWEAEAAELKLREFEARCAKKASQYEERIARLENEIARRAGNLQLLPQLQPPTHEEVKDDVNDAETKESKTTLKPPPEKLPEGRVLEKAKQVVEDIRADRLVNTGWEEGVSEDVQTGLLAMRRSLCAAVERLAMDLYADECHCLWELIQNADDNKYASDTGIPELTLALEVDEEYGAYVLTSNNEVGLSFEDVRAICNVNASLKGAGQTGHKGIGWKSVFRISDCPHVLSNAFAFKFDTRGPEFPHFVYLIMFKKLFKKHTFFMILIFFTRLVWKPF